MINKSHKASIICILRDDLEFIGCYAKQGNSSNYLITGSYDENLYFFDIRKLNEEIYKEKLNCSIWDIKQNLFGKKEKKKLIFMSCIYEGFRVYEFNSEINFLKNEKNKFGLDLLSWKENGKQECHNSIVYGLDMCNVFNKNMQCQDLISVTCSFYDNKIILWNVEN